MRTDDDAIPWKRMRYRERRVWVAVDADGAPLVHDGRARIRYRLDLGREYRVRAGALQPADPGGGDGEGQLPIDFGPAAAVACPVETVCLFAEGAVLGRPGNGGVGIVLRYGEREKTLAAAIGPATEASAALEAIGRGLAAIRRRDRPVRVYTGSGYAYGVLALGWTARRHAGRVRALRRLMGRFADIRVIWPTEPVGRGPTERARRLARQAAEGEQT